MVGFPSGLSMGGGFHSDVVGGSWVRGAVGRWRAFPRRLSTGDGFPQILSTSQGSSDAVHGRSSLLETDNERQRTTRRTSVLSTGGTFAVMIRRQPPVSRLGPPDCGEVPGLLVLKRGIAG